MKKKIPWIYLIIGLILIFLSSSSHLADYYNCIELQNFEIDGEKQYPDLTCSFFRTEDITYSIGYNSLYIAGGILIIVFISKLDFSFLNNNEISQLKEEVKILQEKVKDLGNN